MSPRSNRELQTVLKSSFLFTIVRHPLLRLVSAYRCRTLEEFTEKLKHYSFVQGIKFYVIQIPMLAGASVTRYIVTVTSHVSRGQSLSGT